jgi:predicted nuclease of predicted toxin-antitoxin system
MKLLLDENLPKRLKNDLSEYEIYTVRDKEWNGKKNGELLKLMIADGFDALLTFDKNLQYQQNFNKYSLPVILLNAPDNSYITLRELVPKLKTTLSQPLIPGPIAITK